MPERTAILFPGQGAGGPDDRYLVARAQPDLLELAISLTGTDPFARISEGTRYAQPAVYCASIAAYEEHGRPTGDYFAGHSLGEVAALAAAGAIDEGDGLRIAVARGTEMQRAIEAGAPGGMLAVGSERAVADRLARAHGLAVANENSPAQFVLSGPAAAIEAAAAEAKQTGLRVRRLAIRGAFHTDAIAAAIPAFRAALDPIEFRRPRAPVISCATARPFPNDARGALAASITRPVRWLGVVARLHDDGVGRFIDAGPGKVLAGLARRCVADAEVEALTEREGARA